jgi:hypothetical protein
MANEEIKVKFGGDLGPLGTALRGMKGMVDKVGDSMKESFKDVWRNFSGPISIAGAFEAVKSMMEDVKNIKRISESTGLDTGITQDLLNLGKAAGLAGNDIEAAMDKFVKGLKEGDDPGDALNRLADKMASIQDPAERARLATEAFGRSGVKLIPILKEGSDGIRKMSEEWGKLSDAEIDQIEHANLTLEKLGQKSKVVLAQILEGTKMTDEEFKKMPLWEKLLGGPAVALFKATKDAGTPDQSELDADNVRENAKVENARKAAEKRKEDALKAAKELAEQEELIAAKPQEKVLMLTREILAIRREMEDSDDDKERAKLAEKMLGLERDRKGVQDEIVNKAKETAQKQKELSKQLLEDQKKLAQLQLESAPGAQNRQYGTLQEVANSGFMALSGSLPFWMQGPLAAEAQRAQFLDARAHRERIFGNKSGAEEDEALSQKLKQDLEDQGAIAPTISDHLKSIKENSSKMQTDIASLTAKIAQLKQSQE